MRDTLSEEDLHDFDPELRRAFEFAKDHVDPSLVDHTKVKMHKDSIKLSGDATFYTLQGEGPTMGLPCVFCRLHVCNLRCTWCDAWYTWNPNTTEFWTESRDVSFAGCAHSIQSKWGCTDTGVQKRVIFSGGEPLIQRKQIEEVVRRYLNREYDTNHEPHWKVEIETNGTLMPTEWMLETCQFNCSPKLANSENKEHSMVKPKILDALSAANVNTMFKFVCKDENDLDEIEEKYLPHIPYDRVLIMPEGIVEEEITGHARALYEPCMQRGFRMMPRFQAIFADGARRGI